MKLADRWGELDGEKLEWAFAAYRAFVASLSQEVGERLGQNEHQAEPYVVVFGKTQVGKTTLLLDLMGVLPEQLVRVSAVLRGGRRQGQSATATAMEYRRSPDWRWGLRDGDAAVSWHADDDAMQQALGTLRAAMEARQLQVRAPCVAYLPCDCFDAAIVGPAVRMLDLPGDKPANAAEQEHVNQMARDHVPLADLILLVGRGDDLSFLQPGGLNLPIIEDWQSAPRRFRIVTTFSFFAQTVRELVREEAGPADATRYRHRLIEQISRSVELSEAARDVEHYFPLEFGQSMLDAHARQRDFHVRLAPMLAGLRQQLLDEIHAATTPLARLRSAVEAHVVIARIREKRLERMREQATHLENELQRSMRDHQQARQSSVRTRAACAARARQLAQLRSEQLQVDLERMVNVGYKPQQPGEYVSHFRMAIQTARSKLHTAMHDTGISGTMPSERHEFWRSLRPEVDAVRVEQILSDEFRLLQRELSSYLIDAYVFTGDNSDYRRDCQIFESSIESACTKLTGLLRETRLRSASVRLREETMLLVQQQRQLRDWEALADQAKAKVDVLTQALAAHKGQREAFEQQMDRDLAESQRFRDLLDQHFLHELQQRSQAIRCDPQPATAFLALLAAHQLSQVRQKVLLKLDINLA